MAVRILDRGFRGQWAKIGESTCHDYNHGVNKNIRYSERRLDERIVAEVLAQTITAVQSQKIPAEDALKTAMETIGVSQKAALDLLLYAAHAQAASGQGTSVTREPDVLPVAGPLPFALDSRPISE